MTSKPISLRALEPEDIDFLFQVENQLEWFPLTAQKVPLSRFVLEQYLTQAHLSIEEAKQFRFGIDHQQLGLIGLMDLYDFDAHHRRAGVGIVIAQEYQHNGFALKSLEAVERYVREVLSLHQIYAEVLELNIPALQLFEKAGYQSTGQFKNWWFSKGEFHHMQLFQKIIHD